MPFVPLRSRKRLEVVLDDDKEMMASRQLQKDLESMKTFTGAPPYASTNFAGRTMARAQAQEAAATWRASQLEFETQRMARSPTVRSPTLRTSHSSPELGPGSVGEAMQAAHPLSIEINRWEQIAHKTVKIEMKDVEVIKKPPELPPPKVHKVGGLVNFPKYMLINDCWLKQQDLQRFQRQQEELARQAAEEEERRVAGFSPSSTQADAMMRSSVKLREASWGSPKLKDEGRHWAGSALPAGRCQRTSNPFRMG